MARRDYRKEFHRRALWRDFCRNAVPIAVVTGALLGVTFGTLFAIYK